MQVRVSEGYSPRSQVPLSSSILGVPKSPDPRKELPEAMPRKDRFQGALVLFELYLILTCLVTLTFTLFHLKGIF